MNFVVLIPLSIGLGLIGVAAFFWALHNNQFDDPEGNAWRVLRHETPPRTKGETDDNRASHADYKNT